MNSVLWERWSGCNVGKVPCSCTFKKTKKSSQCSAEILQLQIKSCNIQAMHFAQRWQETHFVFLANLLFKDKHTHIWSLCPAALYGLLSNHSIFISSYLINMSLGRAKRRRGPCTLNSAVDVCSPTSDWLHRSLCLLFLLPTRPASFH